MSLIDEVNRSVATSMARLVEQVAAMARAHGFEFPTEYQFGVGSKIQGLHIHLRLRINDFVLNYRPILADGRSFITDLHKAAMELVSEYIADRVELDPTRKKSIVEAINTDRAAWEKKVDELVDAQLKTVTYRDITGGKR